MRTRKECDISCPFCESETVIRYGKRNNLQRYKCKACNHFFTSECKKISCSRASKRAISLLLNLLNNDFYNVDNLQEAINNASHDKTAVSKIYFNNEYREKTKNELRFACYNPKLLICVDDTAITFIQLPKAKYENNTRSIIINDQLSLKNKNRKPSCTPYLK